MFNANTLFASLVWGSVGLGFFIYGKKQADMVSLFGGLLMIGLSYFVGSAMTMSLASLGLLAGIYWLKKLGH